MTVTGTGIPTNPYVVTSNVTSIKTGFKVQYNNVDVVRDVHGIDFRGSAVSISPGTDEAVITVTVPDPTSGVVIPTGAIWMFGMSNPPAGWLLCDGRTNLLILDYPNLFAAISTNFGGNGTTTFGVPNLVDRFPVGISATKPISGVNNTGGSATKGIGVSNLPPHLHAIDHNHQARNTSSAGQHDHDILMSDTNGGAASARRGTGDTQAGGGPVKSAPGHQHVLDLGNYVGTTGATTGATATPIDVMPPWQALAFCIKT